MRVTSTGTFASIHQAVTDAAGRAERARNLLASGEKVSKASDSPVDAAALLRVDSNLSAIASYQRNIVDARGWLNTADAALQDAINVLGSAGSLSIAGANSSRDPQQREAIAMEIDALAEQLSADANAKYLGTAVFAGHSTEAVSYDSGTGSWLFTGTTGAVNRQIDASSTMDVSLDGQDVFGFMAGDDVFTVLKDLSAAIRAGDTPAISAAAGRLDARTDAIADALETVGTRTNAVERLANRLDLTTVDLSTARAEIGEMDLTKAVLDVQSTQYAYEAAVAAAGQAGMVSLLDFIR